jgi:hypothetical protein
VSLKDRLGAAAEGARAGAQEAKMKPKTCWECRGSGQVRNPQLGMASADPMGVPVSVTCPTCGGAGKTGGGGGAQAEPGPIANGIGWLIGRVLLAILLVIVAFFAAAPLMSLWAGADGTLRPILEAMPFGDAVAERPKQSGDPLLVAVVAAIPLLAFVIGSGLWRRTLIRKELNQEIPSSVVTAVTYVRIAIIAVWVGLIPVLAAMADGRDLRASGTEDDFFSAWWAWLIALAIWVAIASWDDDRAHERLERRMAWSS